MITNYGYYYYIKPFLPRRLQILLRSYRARLKRHTKSHVWPIDPASSEPPKNWKGWPDGKQFAFVLNHDVESQVGHDRCLELAALEKDLGFFSTFNFVPEAYQVSPEVRHQLRQMGFRVGVHGLVHDGKLFNSYKIFTSRAPKINGYLKDWETGFFASPSTARNFEWMHLLDIRCGTTSFDTDPFEPNSEGIQKIFPVWVQPDNAKKGYLELPYTLTQDISLFVLLKEKNAAVWQKKVDWLAEKGGMALLNTHPDYMIFSPNKGSAYQYPVEYYLDVLKYVRDTYSDRCWFATAEQVADFWHREMAQTTT